MEPKNNNNNSFEETKDKVQSKKNSIARNVGDKFIKKAGKHGAKNVVSKKAVSVLLQFAPVIGWVLIALLILFIILGLISFFLTMPGLMMDKISSLLDSIAGISDNLENGVLVRNADVIELAKYIEGMDYDLVGYGFVRPERSESYPVPEQLSEQGYELVTVENEDKDSDQKYIIYYEKDDGTKYGSQVGEDKFFYHSDGKLYYSASASNNSDDIGKLKKETDGTYRKFGIIYDNDNKIKDLNEDDKNSILRTYAVAEKRIYIMRNCLGGIKVLKNLISNLKDFSRGYTNAWAQGMLEFWKAEDGVSDSKMYNFWSKGSIKISGKNQLVCDGGWSDNPMTFDMNGWIGRYGLSTDFLISLHLATLSPELVTTICQSFDIRAQVYLDYIEDGAITAYYHTLDMKKGDEDIFASYEDLKEEKGSGFSGLYLNRKEAKKIMDKYKIQSLTSGIYACDGKDPTDVIFAFGFGRTDKSGSGLTYSDVCLGKEGVEWRKNIFDNKFLKGKDSWGCEIGDKPLFKVFEITDATQERVDKYEALGEKMVVSKDYGDYTLVLSGNPASYAVWVDDKFEDYAVILKDGKDGKAELYDLECHKDDAWFKQEEFDILMEYLEYYYDYIREWATDDDPDNNHGIVNRTEDLMENYESLDDYPDKCPLNENTFFDPNPKSGYHNISEYISFSELLNYENSKKNTEEYVIATWPTNDRGLVPGDPDYDEDEDGEIVLSILGRKEGTDKNYDFLAVAYKNYSTKYMEDHGYISEQDKSYITCSKDDEKMVCSNCRKYVSDIIKSLKKIDDQKFKTYVPYIARVVGSWFRDTYFVLPKDADHAIKSIYDEYDEYGSDKLSLTVSDTELIEDDSEFLEATGELWTSYIMDHFDYNYALFVIDSDGSYLESQEELDNWKAKQIELAKKENRDLNKLNELLQYVGKLSKKKSSVKNDYYYGYIDVYKGVSIDKIDFETSKYIEELFKENDISFIKRANTKKVDDTKGWNAYEFGTIPNEGIMFPLSISEDTKIKIRRIHDQYNLNLERNDSESKEENVFYYSFDGGSNMVNQVKDAFRGMTNEKIKYLFKNRKYYKYDGTIPTAFEIRDDWNECLQLVVDQVGKSNLVKQAKKATANSRIAMNHSIYRTDKEKSLWYCWRDSIFSGLSEEEMNELEKQDQDSAKEDLLNAYIDDYYYTADTAILDKYFNSSNPLIFVRDFNSDGCADIASPNYINNIGTLVDGIQIDEDTKFTYDPRNPSLISKIDIDADGLSAFSILENAHTLDADYAYRDFKELIVELDYFDKEDLVEPQKDILEWILPETGSAGWPVGKYDKYNDFGKLIHSKEMYDNFDLLLETAQVESIVNDSLFEGFQKGQAIVSPATAKIIEMGTTTISNETSEQLFETMYEVRDEYDEQNESNTQNNSSDSEENSATKIFVTESQKEIINNKSEELTLDQNNTFGKTYTTGYIKLEVIGKESVDKILSVINDKQTQDGITAFYEEYRNGKYDSSGKNTSVNPICDSYTIYIEGIDFRLDQSEGASWEFENTIINQIIKEQENFKNNTSNTNNKNDDDKEQPKLTWTPKTETGEITKIIDNYTEKEIPKYYPEAKRDQMKDKEEFKKNMPFVINFDYKNTQNIEEKQIYVKAGTLLGLCTDANIKIMMKDTDYAVVENVEDYLEIDEFGKNIITVGGEISASENGVRTEEDIIYAIEHAPGWNEAMKNNVKSMMDGLLKMQTDFDIDPLVAIALFRGESGVGTSYEQFGQFRLDNHQCWQGCKCTYRSSQGFACYDNYNDAAYDFGNYVRNRFNDGGDNITTWDDMANFREQIIYENCNVDDGNHAISFYKDLVKALESK